jgi:Fe-S-cluster containining protein
MSASDVEPEPAPAPARLTRTSPFAYTCNACSRCCHNYRIKVNPYEVFRIARHLGLSTTEFLQQHLAEGPMLKRRDDGACEFLGPQGCTIHPARPLVCRLYPLGRHVTGAGVETFKTLAPHPQSAGVYGGQGTVDDYLQSQGAGPFLDAVDRWLDVFRRLQAALEASLGDDEDLRTEARAAGERQIEQLPPGLLDPDPMLGEHCRANGLPLPTDPEQAMTLHIAAIFAWLQDTEPKPADQDHD